MDWNEMRCNTLVKKADDIFRIIKTKEDTVFAIDCKNNRMPKWVDKKFFIDFTVYPEEAFIKGKKNYPQSRKKSPTKDIL